ncbi:MAG TPA: GNAT family N-acetyltransferase [Rhodothermales bacterium]|nr:GNAT family N-acetyltransferase [Rhodothermales bacterium]
MKQEITIYPAHEPQHIPHVYALFQEYADWLGIDLSYQNFEQELANLPGAYAPPTGAVFLAALKGRIAGCVALRPLGEGICEMKRLYVRPAFQGHGLGRQLAELIITAGHERGYHRMVLDTLDRMQAAQALYASLGFREIESYYQNPLDGVHFMELVFRGGAQ